MKNVINYVLRASLSWRRETVGTQLTLSSDRDKVSTPIESHQRNVWTKRVDNSKHNSLTAFDALPYKEHLDVALS